MEGNWKNFRIQSSFPATEFLTAGRVWVGRKRSRILHPSDRGISYKVDVHLLRKKRTNKETRLDLNIFMVLRRYHCEVGAARFFMAFAGVIDNFLKMV